MVRNDGGPSQGIAVSVWGPALDRGLFEPTAVEVRFGFLEPRAVQSPLEKKQADGMTARLARFPNVKLAPGVEKLSDHETVPAVTRKSARRGRAIRETTFSVRVAGEAVAPGTGDVYVAVVPLVNPREGAAGFVAALRITETPRRPLHYQDRPGISSALRMLEEPRMLFALAALGADQETCAEVVGDAIERWNAVLCPDGRGQYATSLQREALARPIRGQLEAKDLLHDPHWREVRQALPACEWFSGNLRPEATASRDPRTLTRGAGGFRFSRWSGYSQQESDERVPFLGLWLDLSNCDTGRTQAATKVLISIVDDVTARTAGLQAIVAQWNWAPVAMLHTPYEGACGVSSQFTAGRAWCSRFLKGVSEQLWLGPELLSYLRGTADLESIAELTHVGRVVRVTLRESASLDDLERALAPILPSREDYERVTEQLQT
jgi:hypothetical protein